MLSCLRSLSICACLIGYTGLVVERLHGPGWWWYALILCGMTVYHLSGVWRKR